MPARFESMPKRPGIYCKGPTALPRPGGRRCNAGTPGPMTSPPYSSRSWGQVATCAPLPYGQATTLSWALTRSCTKCGWERDKEDARLTVASCGRRRTDELTMAQFQSFTPDIEVNGQAIIAFVAGMEHYQKRALEILERNGITDPNPGKQ